MMLSRFSVPVLHHHHQDPTVCYLDALLQGLSFCESITGERKCLGWSGCGWCIDSDYQYGCCPGGSWPGLPCSNVYGETMRNCDYGWQAGSGQAVPAVPSSSSVPAAPRSANAGPSSISNGPGAIRPMPTAARAHHFKVNVENKCHVAIWVAAQFIHMDDGEWRAEGWWKLNPGEKAYIIDTVNRYLYLYATDQGGRMVWKGDFWDCQTVAAASKVCEWIQKDMGEMQTEFTVPFSC